MFERSLADFVRHFGKARVAAVTALIVSSASAPLICETSSPVAGLRTLKVSPPPSTHAPSI